MFISQFTVENWQGTQNHGSVQRVETWSPVEAAINQLDADRKTLVTLETDGATHMAIGGGNGKYWVYLTFDNEQFLYAINPSKPNMDVTLTIGGQAGLYPAKWCVDKETALKAAKTFIEQGAMESSVMWEQD